jgi:hypothetical protein
MMRLRRLAADRRTTAAVAAALTLSVGAVTGALSTGVATATTAGSGWTATKAPLPANAGAGDNAQIVASACASASACAAVGNYTDTSDNELGLLLTGAKSSWVADEAPLPSGAASNPEVNLPSVACKSASSCVAVGYYTDSSGIQQGVVLTGAGTSWKATRAQPPSAASNPDTKLTSVACGTSSCVAAGYYTNAAGDVEGLLLTGSGTAWTAQVMPLPARAAANPDVNSVSVACPPKSATCTAIGVYTDTSGRYHPVLLTGSGTAWTAVKGPLPGSAATFGILYLTEVTCASVSECAAVGSFGNRYGEDEGLLLTGSGQSWTAVKAPLPHGAAGQPETYLDDVVCPAPSSCTVSGYYNNPTEKYRELVETGWGKSWKDTHPPLPPKAPSGISAGLTWVACPSATACVATGGMNHKFGGQQGLVLTGAGTSWTAMWPKLPAGHAPHAFVHLFSVTCPSTTTCLVTGGYQDASNNGQGLLLTGQA